MTPVDSPIRIGIVGLGGFALAHHDAVQALEKEGLCRLVCTTDHGASREPERVGALLLSERKVKIFSDYTEMLDTEGGELDMLIVPTPIPLHRPMHRDCVERGIACYLEKPPTLMIDELEAMLAVERQAKRETFVGFNYIREPHRLSLKQRLLDGEFGELLRGSYLGLWSRPESYYQRAPWAGKLFVDGAPVVDSCLGNAMAHLVFNLLFWGGTDQLLSWGEVDTVSAELYRANSIESTDTMFARLRLTSGVDLTFAASHACEEGFVAEERLECSLAVIHCRVGGVYRIEWKDGRVEASAARPENSTAENLRGYFSYLRGEEDRPLIRLEDTKSFVQFYNLLFVAAPGIRTIPQSDLKVFSKEERDRLIVVPEIQDIARKVILTEKFPSEQGLSWARAGGTATLAQLPEIGSCLQQIHSGLHL